MMFSKGSLTGRIRYMTIVAAAMAALVVAMAIPCLSASTALAEIRRTGSSVVFGGHIHVTADEIVEGGAASIGGRVTVDGHVLGDAVSIGGPVEINGTVDGDVVSVGSNVSLVGCPGLGSP